MRPGGRLFRTAAAASPEFFSAYFMTESFNFKSYFFFFFFFFAEPEPRDHHCDIDCGYLKPGYYLVIRWLCMCALATKKNICTGTSVLSVANVLFVRTDLFRERSERDHFMD